ncbi:MAG: hypothetical protein DRP08_07235, partial [Candidatus Aenigmatarchaeota archaeon]
MRAVIDAIENMGFLQVWKRICNEGSYNGFGYNGNVTTKRASMSSCALLNPANILSINMRSGMTGQSNNYCGEYTNLFGNVLRARNWAISSLASAIANTDVSPWIDMADEVQFTASA